MKEKDSLTYVFSGSNVKKFFENEIGTHRWQRIPPTESKCRMHTSSVTVSVLDEKKELEIDINYNDVEVIYTKGSGPGGQHKNTTCSCVILKHKPTNIQVKVDGRNQHRNEDDVWKELKKRLQTKLDQEYNEKYSSVRSEQVGFLKKQYLTYILK
jgi:peptide chain release factor 1